MVDLLSGELLRARSRRMPFVLVVVVTALLVLGGAVLVVRGGEPIHLEGRWLDLIPFASIHMAWASAVLGASLVGAEFHSGGITQVVNWEARRGRVVAAKLVVAAVAGWVCAVVLVAVASGIVLVLGALDLVTGIDSFGGDEARSLVAFVVVGALAAVVGGSSAFLLRSSLGGVVTVTLLLLIVEPLVGAIVKPFSNRGPMHGLTSLTGHPESTVMAHGGDIGSVLTAVFWMVVMAALAYQAFVARDLSDSD